MMEDSEILVRYDLAASMASGRIYASTVANRARDMADVVRMLQDNEISQERACEVLLRRLKWMVSDADHYEKQCKEA